MSALPPEGDRVLAELVRQVRDLVAAAGGPLRRIRLHSENRMLEIEWHGVVTKPAANATAAGNDAAADRLADPGDGRPGDTPETSGSTIPAPMVGTFYRAPEPGAKPFVEIGDQVQPGQVVGIVEAMKLMNQVAADRVGTVVELLAGDGEPVEFGQPLLRLAPLPQAGG